MNSFIFWIIIFSIFGLYSNKKSRNFYYNENQDPDSPSFDTNYILAPSMNNDIFKYITGKKKTVNQTQELRTLKIHFVIFHLLLLKVVHAGYLYQLG